MAQQLIYGLGGYCENCDETHDHQLNNLIQVVELPEEETSE